MEQSNTICPGCLGTPLAALRPSTLAESPDNHWHTIQSDANVDGHKDKMQVHMNSYHRVGVCLEVQEVTKYAVTQSHELIEFKSMLICLGLSLSHA